MNRKSKIILVVCVLVVLISLVFTFPREGNPVLLDIRPGMSAGEVAGALKIKGVISNEKLFLVLLRLIRADRKIKKGTYELNTGMSFFRLIGKLISGEVLLVKVTVPEGFTSVQIAELVARNNLGSREKFLDIVLERNLEGYLFPETYMVPLDSTEEDIIKMMTKQFNKVFSEELLKAGQKYNFKKKDIVILASIIEREAVREDERRMISAVFHNRLKRRYYLESCATVLYVLGKHKDKLLYEDLEVESPYNTYRNFGLPPGPICNPGLNSLKAAVYPEKTDMMFFVSNGDGTHKFSSQYKRHLEVQKEN